MAQSFAPSLVPWWLWKCKRTFLSSLSAFNLPLSLHTSIVVAKLYLVAIDHIFWVSARVPSLWRTLTTSSESLLGTHMTPLFVSLCWIYSVEPTRHYTSKISSFIRREILTPTQNGTICFMSQLFFAHRCWRVTHRSTPVLCILILSTAVIFAGDVGVVRVVDAYSTIHT